VLLSFPATALRADDDVPRDLLLTVAARRALLGDDDLSRLAAGVSVRHGFATLWGSSPSAQLTARAVERLRHVPGVIGVRSEVLPAPQAEAELGRPAESDDPGPLTPRAAPAPTALAGRIGPPGRVPAVPSSASSAAPPDAAVSLSGPVLGTAAAPPTGRRPPAELGRPVPRTSPADAPSPAPAPDLAAAVERLRRGDGRFDQLRAVVEGGAVVLHGTVRRGEDLTAFARAAAGLAGVERVVIDQVRVLPGP
jgi:hypothetical protein